MIQQGIIEKVVVPSSKNKSNVVKCFRLVQGEQPLNAEHSHQDDVEEDEDYDPDDSGTCVFFHYGLVHSLSLTLFE